VIHRFWSGLVRRGAADKYIAHLRTAVFPDLEAIDGYRGGEVLRRATPRGVEFVVTTRWTSLDAIRKFAGEDHDLAVVPPAARALMVEFDETVRHYEAVE